MRVKILISYLIFSLLLISSTFSQQTKRYADEAGKYQEAVELFDKEKYTAAQEKFEEITALFPENHEYHTTAEYYIAICAIELFHEDAEYLISRFISKYPESSKVNEAYFNMGRFQYRQEKFSKVTQWLEKIDKDRLNEEQLSEYYFKLGYSYFKTGNNTKASEAFYEIKDTDTRFAGPALYYYSHISYDKENYQTALEGFQSLTGNNTFAPIMPYYITQIYYLQEKYNKVIDYAPQFVQSATAKRLPEIAKIIGDSYFQLQQYDSAFTYLQLHKEKSKSLTRSDHYQFGYVSYQLDKYDIAIEHFEKVTDGEDKMAQNAYYHLADCYLSQDKKNKAKFAFEFASKMDFDPQIKQNALFNYAKITFQLKNTPFNDAIEAFKKYINQYPESEDIDEAYSYLVKAYLNSNNYKDALQSLEQVEELDMPLEKAYQRVAYFRGLELYNNLYYKEAIEVLDKSLTYDQYDKNLAALANYWKAEAYYQLESYEKATEHYNEFLMRPGSFGTDVYNKAHYNLGYTHFQQEKYPEAINWFRKFLSLNKKKESKHLADTYIRLGDCYFMRRSLWQAVDYYDKALEMDIWDQDYALFHRAFALGLLKRPNKKIASLNKLLEQYPKSGYIDDAYFELARSYLNLDKTDEAIAHYNKLIENFPSSSYVRESLVQLGLIHYNQNENQEAMKYFKRTIADYPGTPESKNALTGLKNIYVDMNKVDEYFTYVNGLGDFARVSMSEQDSLTYISAEKVYMNQDCEDALEFLRDYLQKYKNGNFAVNAHFYMADCFNRRGNSDKALEHYQYVIEKPQSAFTEQALSAYADIRYNRKNYQKALEAFKELEKVAEVHSNLLNARAGQMRIQFRRQNFDKAIEAADKVLHTEKVNERQKREALYIKGKSLYEKERYKLALKELQLISDEVNSKEGAEAKYLIADIYFKQGELKVAENEIFDLVKQNSSQEYWKARSFILLSDVYKAMEDNFQAKHTLKSVIENYESVSGEDNIIKLAKEKYNTIIEDEKYSTEKDTTREEMKLEFQKEDQKQKMKEESDTTNSTED